MARHEFFAYHLFSATRSVYRQVPHSGQVLQLKAVFDRTFAFYLWHSLTELDLKDDDRISSIWQSTTASICAADGACVLGLRDSLVLTEMVAVPGIFPIPADMVNASVHMIGNACWSTISLAARPLLLLLHYFISATLRYQSEFAEAIARCNSKEPLPPLRDQIQAVLNKDHPHPAGQRARQQAIQQTSKNQVPGEQSLHQPRICIVKPEGISHSCLIC